MKVEGLMFYVLFLKIFRFFYYVVDLDRIGIKILIEMNRLKLLGEVTLMSFNKLDGKET